MFVVQGRFLRCWPRDLLLAVLCLWLLFPASATALSPSGKAVAVVQATSASGPGGSRTLAAAKPVYSGDRINTGGSGQAQIVFADDTKLVVGPNSSIVIDDFVFNKNNSVAKVSLQMTKGAFRFITGGGPKRAYEIVTPTATLGIRGTAFDVAVGGRVGTGLLVFDGSVRMCSRRNGQCTVVNRGCGAAVVTNQGNIGEPNSNADKAALIRAAFPLVPGQDRLRSAFRVNIRGCGQLSVPPPARGGVRQINLSPARGNGSPPGNDDGASNPPGGGGGTTDGSGAPGASSNTNGGTRSASSSGSSTSRSNPGNSGNSNAGGNGKSKGKK